MSHTLTATIQPLGFNHDGSLRYDIYPHAKPYSEYSVTSKDVAINLLARGFTDEPYKAAAQDFEREYGADWLQKLEQKSKDTYNDIFLQFLVTFNEMLNEGYFRNQKLLLNIAIPKSIIKLIGQYAESERIRSNSVECLE